MSTSCWYEMLLWSLFSLKFSKTFITPHKGFLSTYRIPEIFIICMAKWSDWNTFEEAELGDQQSPRRDPDPVAIADLFG